MTNRELFLFFLAAYGGAWIVSKALITKRPREALDGTPFLGEMVKCIVCVSVWTAFLEWAVMPHSELLGGHRLGFVDGCVLALCTAPLVWWTALKVGDAD